MRGTASSTRQRATLMRGLAGALTALLAPSCVSVGPKTIFSFLMVLLSLTESGGGQAAPVLTVGAG